jgi:multicomponent Na+:H+ antiporter subunit D
LNLTAQLPILIPAPLLVASLAVPVVWWFWRRTAYVVVLAAVGTALAASIGALAHVVRTGEALVYQLGGWAPPVGIEYVVDHVAAYVSVVVTGVGLVGLVATRRWVTSDAATREGPFYALCLLLLTGLTGIVVTADLFNVFVFLEISSLSAYALVFQGGERAMVAAFRYLILGTIGGTFYLLGVGFIYFATGTLNMADAHQIMTQIGDSRAMQAAAVFIFTGMGLKMALVPLHSWLPDAYTNAPSSVNSLMAPIMTKVMAYVMVRMFLSVFPDGYLTNVLPIADVLVVAGLVGMAYGGATAIGQRDVRRMLAYSSIGQLGMIAVGIGLGTPLAMAAALLHVANHAAMKSTLFLAAASVRYVTGSSRIADFAGLGRRMPFTMTGFSLAALAMVGIPPAAGFFSKWYLVQAGLEQGAWAVVAVVLASSLLSATYVFRILEQAYLRPLPEDGPGNTARRAPRQLWVPVLLMGIGTVVLGLANAAILTHVLEPGL